MIIALELVENQFQAIVVKKEVQFQRKRKYLGDFVNDFEEKINNLIKIKGKSLIFLQVN